MKLQILQHLFNIPGCEVSNFASLLTPASVLPLPLAKALRSGDGSKKLAS